MLDRIIRAEQTAATESGERQPVRVGIDLEEDLDNLIELLNDPQSQGDGRQHSLFSSQLSQSLKQLTSDSQQQQQRTSDSPIVMEDFDLLDEDELDEADLHRSQAEVSNDPEWDPTSSESSDSGSESEHFAQTQVTLKSVQQAEQITMSLSQRIPTPRTASFRSGECFGMFILRVV